MIGEGNGPEAVIPLSKLGSMGFGGGANITVNVNGGDPNSVVRALQQYVRLNGAVPITTRAM
jgi:phosphotransferase system HPr-like phosphotransfer protein